MTKIIPVLKPDKPAGYVGSSQPVTLLSAWLKLSACLIINRILDKISEYIPIEQARFTKGHIYTDQMLRLTIYNINLQHCLERRLTV